MTTVSTSMKDQAKKDVINDLDESTTMDTSISESEQAGSIVMSSVQTSSSPRTSSGLSELSKQLRILQAKNQAQNIEIDRLERQLRILADLQGISVIDLRRALQEACEAEALGEWKNRVASLRAQLEAASLERQHQIQSAITAKTIANLELKIGELEEMDEKKKDEIKSLYNQLMEQKAIATKYEAQYNQQKEENEALKQKHSSEKEEVGQKIAVRDQNQDELKTKMAALEVKVKNTKMEEQIVNDKLKLSEQQRGAIEDELKLRTAQYKARFMVQDENIEDLKQQLVSLYTAFDLLKEESNQENETRMLLQNNLQTADEQIARQLMGGTTIYHPSQETDNNNNDNYDETTSSPHIVPLSPSQSVSTDPLPPPLSPKLCLDDPVVTGTLLVRGTGVIKKWKKRRASLFSSMTHHHLVIEGFKGVALHFGVSRICTYQKQKFGFVIYVNPERSNATIIYAAATNVDEYKQWMTALSAATTGENILVNDESSSSYITPQKSMTNINGLNDDEANEIFTTPTNVTEKQYDEDLELALEISQRET